MSDTITLPRKLAQKALNDLLAYWEPNATTEALKAALAAPQPELRKSLLSTLTAKWEYEELAKELAWVKVEPQPVKQADAFTISGQLTALKCWHRLTEAEADDLIVFTAMLTGAKP